MSRRIESLRLQLIVTELLRLLHRDMSYAELEKLLGVPRSVLAQYATGARVPSPYQARLMLSSILDKINMASIIASRLKATRSIADLEYVMLDPLVIRLVSAWAEQRYRGSVDVVLSAETIGVPLATQVALSLEARLVLARRQPGSTHREYIRGEGGEQPFGTKVFYVPRDALGEEQRVLLVDDLVRTGSTFEALVKAVKAGGGRVVGAVVVIAIGSTWRRRLEKLGVRDVHAFLEIS
ncbi:MAG: phosphoribosyltransferase family protein [Pyrodictiaceae archaeon]